MIHYIILWAVRGSIHTILGATYDSLSYYVRQEVYYVTNRMKMLSQRSDHRVLCCCLHYFETPSSPDSIISRLHHLQTPPSPSTLDHPISAERLLSALVLTRSFSNPYSLDSQWLNASKFYTTFLETFIDGNLASGAPPFFDAGLLVYYCRSWWSESQHYYYYADSTTIICRVVIQLKQGPFFVIHYSLALLFPGSSSPRLPT
jgi:hypothetical protein